ncbi:MAG: hypothetical protein RIQ81_2032 [Pseudomonadota bacterium]
MFSHAGGMAAGILTSWVRSLSSRLPETLTGLVASVVFGALFLHVFRDLLSPDMVALAPAVITKATWAGMALILAGGVALTRRAMAADLTLGWGLFGRLRGLPESVASRMEDLTRFSWAAILGTITGGAAVFAGHAVLTSPESRLAVFAAGFFLCTLPAFVFSRRDGDSFSPQQAHTNRHLFRLVASNSGHTQGHAARLGALARWRTGLILRTPLTWLLAAAWSLCMAGVVAAAAYKVPLPFIALFAWLGGWLASLPLALHAASEARELPFEEAFGVTRGDIARAYMIVAAMIAILCGITPALITLLNREPVDLSALTCLGAGAMAPSLMPFLLWQVDARRPLVQALTSLFSSMFLATAIIATKAAFLLWPVVLVLLAHQQNKRILHEQTVTTGI